MPYLGQFLFAIDSAGRFNVPAKFREILQQEPSPDLILIRGFDRCVYLFPGSTWAKFRAPLDHGRFQSDTRARWFIRELLRDGSVQTPDAQGRIQIPQGLREHAGIQDQVLVLGNDDRIEVWAPEGYDRHIRGGHEMGLSLQEEAGRYFGGFDSNSDLVL